MSLSSGGRCNGGRGARSNPNTRRGRREKKFWEQNYDIDYCPDVVTVPCFGGVQMTRHQIEAKLSEGISLFGSPEAVIRFYRNHGWGDPRKRGFWRAYMRREEVGA